MTPNVFNPANISDRLLEMRMASYRRILSENKVDLATALEAGNKAEAALICEMNEYLTARCHAIFNEQMAR